MATTYPSAKLYDPVAKDIPLLWDDPFAFVEVDPFELRVDRPVWAHRLDHGAGVSIEEATAEIAVRLERRFALVPRRKSATPRKRWPVPAAEVQVTMTFPVGPYVEDSTPHAGYYDIIYVDGRAQVAPAGTWLKIEALALKARASRLAADPPPDSPETPGR